jgi:cell wall assembly regulator SMI1
MKKLIEKLFSLISSQTQLDHLPFNEGCSASELKQLEDSLKVTLPDDYKTFLRHSNGQADSSLTFPPDQLVFLSTEEVVRLWNELNQHQDDQFFDQFEFDQKIRAVLYHPGRIPIAYNEIGGAYLFLDYIPGPNGKSGQVIFNTNEADNVVIEDTFHDLIGTYLQLLEAGKMVVKKQPPEYGQGYWFVSDNDEYTDWEVFQRLKGKA